MASATAYVVSAVAASSDSTTAEVRSPIRSATAPSGTISTRAQMDAADSTKPTVWAERPTWAWK